MKTASPERQSASLDDPIEEGARPDHAEAARPSAVHGNA